MHYMYDKVGIRNVYMLTGGGAMTLNDAVALHGKFRVICNHHEQACAMAAVGESKYTNTPSLVIPTTGCGGTNTITGLLDAWQDNLPVIFVSGQAKTSETSATSAARPRQFGVQEADIISMVKSITKYSIMITDATEVNYHLEKAVHLATSGRPGPVWLDIPLDIQGKEFDAAAQKQFSLSELADEPKISATADELNVFKKYLAEARRPIIIAGNGIRLGNAVAEFHEFLKVTAIPIVASYLSVDLIASDNDLHIGRLGVKGDRAGNFAVQNSDLIIVWGCRLSVALTGYDYASFGRAAKIVVIDIDPREHAKNTVRIDRLIAADIKSFLTDLNRGNVELNDLTNWKQSCLRWKQKWPICSPEYLQETDGVNMYHFMDRLKEFSAENAAIVSDAGSAYYVCSQATKIRGAQRYITSGAQAEMGFTLPAAIGVSIANPDAQIIGITGDGSFQSNIQELQTIVQNRLPIKLFIWNNHGYLSIQATQRKFFNERYIGTDAASGVSFPEIKKIAAAYGIQYRLITGVNDLDAGIRETLDCEGPVICEVLCPKYQEVIPTLSSQKLPDGRMVSKPIEDMYPFMDRDEFLSEMIVQPIT